MPRQKKPRYEYVPKLKLYRKRIKDIDGKYFPIYAKTEPELAAKVATAQEQITAGLSSRENPTVRQYAERWMDLHAQHVAERTMDDYRYIVRSYVIPSIGDLNVKDVRADDIKAAQGSASDKSESVYNKLNMVLRMIFDSAVENKIISESPCPKFRPGGIPQKEKTALTHEQEQVLVDAVQGTVAETFVMLALYTGMRREEILALQWDAVDLSKAAPHIDVRRSLHWKKNRPIVKDELKSDSAKRTIPLPGKLVEVMKAAKGTSPFVIHNTTDGPLTSSQWRNLWHAVTCRQVKQQKYVRYADGKKTVVTYTPEKGQKARCRNYCYTIDFDVTPHLLRRTYITNLILAGLDVKTVQYLAGHKHARITLEIYAQVMYNQPEDLIDRINHVFSG